MNGPEILQTAVNISYDVLLAAMVLNFWRLARGPDLVDRVVALDGASNVILGLIAVFTIHQHNSVFFIAAVLLALIIFLGTVAIAKYLEEKVLP